MKVFPVQAMRDVDKAAVESGMPSLLLMETAGRHVFEKIDLEKFDKALILCGSGNNGGDGLVVARYLFQAGIDVELFVTERSKTIDVTTMREALKSYGEFSIKDKHASVAASIHYKSLSLEVVQASLSNHTATRTILIDAIFGSGLRGEVEGEYAEIIKCVNHSSLHVLSIDIPSGVRGDHTILDGPYIKANQTVQLAGAKYASVFYPARKAFGEISTVSIGVSEDILDKHAIGELLNNETVSRYLPQREADTHKYRVGTVLVIAGSNQYRGAAQLACMAALRAGAGLVTLASNIEVSSIIPEVISKSIDWQENLCEQLSDVPENRGQVRLIGPGLDNVSSDNLIRLIASSNVPTVLDASALIADKQWFSAVHKQGNCILTPHVGEAARLLGKTSAEVNQSMIVSAKELAVLTDAIVILKAATTVIADATGRCAVSVRGDSSMATGGSGDSLAGIVAAFVASDMSREQLFERCCAAVYLHGMSGEVAALRFGNGALPSDLISCVGACWLELTNTTTSTNISSQ